MDKAILVGKATINLKIQGSFSQVLDYIKEHYPSWEIEKMEAICIGMTFVNNAYEVRLSLKE